VEACPTGALYHHPDGFVVLDQDKCNGCGYCSQACPFHIPQLDVANPLGQVAFGATVVGMLAAFFVARRNVNMEEVE
jgi:Fe-S-cluster-containing dehydrogenase component